MSGPSHETFWRYGREMLCEDCAGAMMEAVSGDALERFHPMTLERWANIPQHRRVCSWVEDHEAMAAAR